MLKITDYLQPHDSILRKLIEAGGKLVRLDDSR